LSVIEFFASGSYLVFQSSRVFIRSHQATQILPSVQRSTLWISIRTFGAYRGADIEGSMMNHHSP